ncbi:ubiquinone/menaquinone biosynthesis C-methylase UbiE [Bacilli bacterium PM5-9]|nr:ubiquinone/menaquinone biosynthesis C-methylase UbiE [Bacilli bacterium PM5-9]
MIMNKFERKSRDAYNKKAFEYDKTPEGKFTRHFNDLIYKTILINQNDSILDVACGNGRLLDMFARKKDINLYGVDIAEEMIVNAKKLYPTIEFAVGSCEKIPFDDNKFEVIINCASFHHFPNPSEFAKEVNRLLKNNGTLYIADVYYPNWLRIILNPFVPLSKSGDVKFYSPQNIINIFKNYNIRHIETIIDNNIQLLKFVK